MHGVAIYIRAQHVNSQAATSLHHTLVIAFVPCPHKSALPTRTVECDNTVTNRRSLVRWTSAGDGGARELDEHAHENLATTDTRKALVRQRLSWPAP